MLSAWYAFICVEPAGEDHPLPSRASGAYTYIAARSDSRGGFECLLREAAQSRDLAITEIDWACPDELLVSEGRSVGEKEQWVAALEETQVVWGSTFHWWGK
jgi:hypothetical protein